MPIVTISRGSQSGGARLAESLGARLGLRVVSREVMVEAAKTYGLSEDVLKESLQSPPGFWDRQARRRQQYILAVQAALAQMVEGDDVVFHGLAGQLLLRELPNVLKVRLIAPMEQRIRNAMLERDLTREEAARRIQKADEERAAYVRRVYDVDVADPALYDLVLNLGALSMETATEMVVDLLGRKEYRSTPETLQRTKDFALACRVRAELAFKSGFPDASNHVSVDHGVVTMDLPGSLAPRRGDVETFVSGIPGVTSVAGAHGDGGRGLTADAPSLKSAADLMLSIENYPHVSASLPIRDALLAVGASSVVSAGGALVPPRYLLVLDEAERVVGVVNRRNLLWGLIPQYASLKRAYSVSAALPWADSLATSGLLWGSLFSPAAIGASRKPVGSVMAPIRATVSHDDTLGTVVSTMLEHDVDLVPVTEGAKTVGVILMTDVFDNVAEYVLERSAK
jgi:cytidylate kinase